MKNIDSHLHTTGRSQYIDDLPVPEGCLSAAVFGSPIAHGTIKKLDTSAARAAAGVIAVLTSADITGENQIGGIVEDEELLASKEVHFMGQPVAVVVATSEALAQKALRLIAFEADKLPVIVDPRVAAAQGKLLFPPRTFVLGDVQATWAKCDVVVEGRADTGGQEHLYLETQGAFAYPKENGGIHVTSSTQGPTAVQRTAARVLGVPMHQVEVNVQRLGGGFGGKEDQATPWAVMVALAAHRLQRPVKLVLHRMEDMRMTGKRHPYSSDYKIGLRKDGTILAYEVTFYQNGGAATDLSPGVLGRTLFHCTNSYFVPNVKATALSCKTNLPPNTAFRGFGGPQGMFVMEAAISQAAEKLGIDATEIQRKNLLKDGDEFPYGTIVKNGEARRTWRMAEKKYDIARIKAEVKKFNETHEDFKRGVAMMPVCFGISFTNTMMNQASSLVHVYSDGSVSISTAAVEMGQGVNTKILKVAAHIFAIDPTRVRIETTNTVRVANTSPTAASAGADLNGKATEIACSAIAERLRERAATILKQTDAKKVTFKDERVHYDGERTDLTWVALIANAFNHRVNLSQQAHYATPNIHFNKDTEKGDPFAYHVYGTAIVQATIDCVRGRYVIDSVQVVHDFGESMSRSVDLGQAEGAIAQGLGWMTVEELIFNNDGKLLSNALSTYKVPDVYAAPKIMDVHFLEDSKNPMGVFNSKAVGEPPLMYGIGAFFALRNAIRSFRPDREPAYNAPLTPERVLMALHG